MCLYMKTSKLFVNTTNPTSYIKVGELRCNVTRISYFHNCPSILYRYFAMPIMLNELLKRCTVQYRTTEHHFIELKCSEKEKTWNELKCSERSWCGLI